MADRVTAGQLENFLQELGKRYQKDAILYLVGGSALAMLGSRRPTHDIDYIGIDIPSLWDDLQRVIDEIAKEMDLDIEAVPYLEMIPVPTDAAQRHIPLGTYGSVRVFAFDPYSMALGKLDRGIPTDLEDIVYMLNRNLMNFHSLRKLCRLRCPLRVNSIWIQNRCKKILTPFANCSNAHRETSKSHTVMHSR